MRADYLRKFLFLRELMSPITTNQTQKMASDVISHIKLHLAQYWESSCVHFYRVGLHFGKSVLCSFQDFMEKTSSRSGCTNRGKPNINM